MKRSRIRPVSDKRKALNAERKILMEEKFGPREEWRCSFADFGGENLAFVALWTHGGAVNGHEILKRSRGGSITDMENVVLLCDVHNSWVEDNPALATRMGLAAHSWEKP